MKKLIIISLLLGSISSASFASDDKHWGKSDSDHKSSWADGQHRFVAELNLDTDRAAQMEAILASYREVPKLYFTNQSEKIPEFLAQKDAELAALLTPEELAQFKQSFGEWAKKKNFKFMKFSQYQPQPVNQPPQYDMPDAAREKLRQVIDSQFIKIGKQLPQQVSNA